MREREIEKKERWERIENSRYNNLYKWIKDKGIPGYLKKGWNEGRWQRVAKFRLGSRMRESWYYKKTRRRRNVGFVELKWKPRGMYGKNV